MSSSSSTTHKKNTKTRSANSTSPFQAIIAWILIGFWIFLMGIGIATVIDPNWLDFITHGEKTDTAMMVEQAGSDMFYKGNLIEAERLFRDALRIQPNHGNAMIGLGNIYLEYGRIDEAAAMFKKSLENNPVLPDLAYGNLGAIHENKGNKSRALEYYNMAAETAPEATGAIISIGRLYMRQDMHDSAVVYFRTAVNNLLDMKLAYRASMIFAKQHKSGDSLLVADIEYALEEDNFDSTLYDYELFHYSRVFSPRGMESYHMLGVSLALTKNFDEAIPFLEYALNIAPDNNVIRSDLNLARQEAAQQLSQ